MNHRITCPSYARSYREAFPSYAGVTFAGWYDDTGIGMGAVIDMVYGYGFRIHDIIVMTPTERMKGPTE